MSSQRLFHTCGQAIDYRIEQCFEAFMVFRDLESRNEIQACPRCAVDLATAMSAGDLTPQPPAIAGKDYM